jgi:choice-of-anchor C domain-containing protein
MYTTTRGLIAFAAVVALTSAPAKAGLINGSFEEGTLDPIPGLGLSILTDGSTSITGWIVKTLIPGSNIDYISTYWQNSDGNRSIDLDGNVGLGGIAQTVDTLPGKRYSVLFDIASNPTVQGFAPIKTMEVDAAGFSQQYSVDNTGYTRQRMGWVTEQFDFTATDRHTELWFKMIYPEGAEGIGLDNVRLFEAVPEPATIFVALGSLAGIGVWLRLQPRCKANASAD